MGVGRALDVRADARSSAEAALAFGLAEELLVRGRDGVLVPLVANVAQQRFERFAGRRNVVLKARQMGLSTWVAGRFFLKTVLLPGTTSVLVAHTREAAEQIFRVVQRMAENIADPELKERARTTRLNAGQMVFGGIDSEFRVVSAADENAGRGLTIQNLHCSEVSRWPGDAAATLAGLKAALVRDGELVMESTANGAHGAFYEEWREAEANGVVRHFLPWWMEPGYVAEAVDLLSVREDERGLMEREGLSAEQIGFRRGLERTYRGLRAQEFAEDAVSCFRASGTGVFETEVLQPVAPVEERWRGSLHVWLPPVAGRKYVVACDPAGGGSEGDYAAVQVVDVATGMQCAELREIAHPRMLADRVTALATEYGGALVAVERNNHGAAVIAYLEKRGLRMYESGGQVGWLTTAMSRPEMVARLGVLLSERPGCVKSARLVEECRTFVVSRSGRAEAASGAHDDLVMAMGLALSVRETAGAGWSPTSAR